jgi:hypothetical protein
MKNDNIKDSNKINKKINVKAIIYYTIMIIIIIVAWIIYSKYNFYDYTKAIREEGKTSFTRDFATKYSKDNSYKIENKDFNDSMFYKKIKVNPNTPYKVTCMVKTENVVNKENKASGGAQIAINDTTECSRSLSGTNDWTELTFMFNSNNRSEIEIGFRLGGYEEYSKGIAWFSDFKIEEGKPDTDNNWKMACFIIENIDLNVNNKNIKLSMTNDDIYTIESNMNRLQSSLKELSANKMDMTYEIIRIEDPLTTISYDPENEYYVDPDDAKPLIDKYITQNEYDYIYVAVRLGDLNQSSDILVHDWIGLRSYGI